MAQLANNTNNQTASQQGTALPANAAPQPLHKSLLAKITSLRLPILDGAFFKRPQATSVAHAKAATAQTAQQSVSGNGQHPLMTSNEAYKDAIDKLSPQRANYWASLVLTGSLVPLPIVTAIIIATLYIAQVNMSAVPMIPPWITIILVGVVITLLLWLLVSGPFIFFTTFDNANPHSGSHLRRHILTLKPVLELVKEQFNSSSNADGEEKALRSFRQACIPAYTLAFSTACRCLMETRRQIKEGNLPWIMGTGYIRVWNFVHRAEEAMFTIMPREEVIREALHDEASIDGSNIANRNYLLSNIKTAVKTLSPSAGIYLKSLPMQDRNMPAQDSNTGATSQNQQLDPIKELEARNALRDARQTLNEFRDNLWDGLVCSRNRLTGTALITALLTFVLLCVTISVGIPPSSLKAAIIFYLIGGLVGLFSRLSNESQSDSVVDDYGLTITRIILTPLLSGLAAIAGVLVVAILSLNVLNAPGTGPTSNGGLPRLQDVYDLVQNRQGIVTAALFGLTPNLFLNILQQKADDAKAKLKSSSAPNR